MYDSVKIIIPGQRVTENVISNINPLFHGVAGCYKNLRLRDVAAGLIIDGSLPKFYLGNNAESLSRGEIRYALEKIEDECHILLKGGLVWVLEFGRTIPVDNPASCYLSSWCELPRFQKVVYGSSETVLFQQQCKSYTGYDKVCEMKGRKEVFPLNSSFGVKLEFKIKKGVAKFFNKAIAPFDLADQVVYRRLVKKWGDLYFSILKKRTAYLNFNDSVITSKRLLERFAAVGLSEYGPDRALEGIDIEFQKGKIDKCTRSRLRKTVRDFSRNDCLYYSDDYITELNQKVAEAIRDALLE